MSTQSNNYFDQFLITLGLLMAVTVIGGIFLHEYRQKVLIAEKCHKLINYRLNARLYPQANWTCKLNGRVLSEEMLDFTIKARELGDVMQSELSN